MAPYRSNKINLVWKDERGIFATRATLSEGFYGYAMQYLPNDDELPIIYYEIGARNVDGVRYFLRKKGAISGREEFGITSKQ